MTCAFLFRTHVARVSAFRFSVGQDLFCINESLTLDSAKKTDSNRCDSEAIGVLPPERNKKDSSRGPKAWRAHTRRALASNPIPSRDWRSRSRNLPIIAC